MSDTHDPSDEATVNPPLTAKRPRKRAARWVEDQAYGDAVARMVKAYGKRLAQADAGDLPQLAELAHLVEEATAQAVTSMRARGVTWAEIGEAFNITRQAAQQRWSR